MAADTSRGNPSALVIRSLLHREHAISLFAKDMPHVLAAEIIELDEDSGRLVLEIDYRGKEIERYLADGMLSFDIEALYGQEGAGHEIYNIDKISARLLKTDSHTYRLDCQLPESVFVHESRGAIRIPCILGMQARVSMEIYLHELSVMGRLSNLSVGGCMIDVGIEDSIALAVDQRLPGVTLEFPNGDRFHAEGLVRHIRPFGSHGHAAVGIQFLDLSPAQSEALFYYVAETEREAAYRAGIHNKVTEGSPLFIPGPKEKQILQREEKERQKSARQSPMLRGVLEVAHQLQVMLMFMKNREQFPEDTLYDCVDTLLHLVGQDRKAFLYALACLRGEPDWVRHAVQVAGELADLLLLRDPHSPQVREAVVGALLHTLGKPLLVSERLPSLKAHMKPYQKEILRGHVTTLLDKLDSLGWAPSPTCRDVLANASERLDGTGYPAGKRGDELSELVRLVSVIKIVNKLTHERNGVPPRAPLDAYRWVNDQPETYDKTMLVEYIQQRGLYPIGSLAKFSGGFLAWIIDVDSKGMPNKVNVIKNLAFQDTSIDTVLGINDFTQIGKLEGVVNPLDYGIAPIRQ